jgi:hypothetical protein
VVRVIGRLSRDNDGLKWDKEREMNITHEGKTYEVLTLDRISEITHAKLAGGKVVDAQTDSCGASIAVGTPVGCREEMWFQIDELADFGIQPLRLVPVEPVTFEGVVVLGTFHGCDMPVILAPNVPLGTKFQLTQKEEA